VLLLAAAGAAYGVAVTMKRGPPAWAALPAVLLYLLCGVHAVLLAWITGAGVALPGLQISPGLKSWYFAELVRESRPVLPPALLLLAIAAHALVLFPRPDRKRWLHPLPATLLFVALFSVVDARGELPPIPYDRALGPGGVAFLTVVPDDEGARIVVAQGEPGAAFLAVLHDHRTNSRPPELRLGWTKDGKGLFVVAEGERKPAFAVDLGGNAIGRLPVEAHEWPQKEDAYVPTEVRRRVSQARVDVARFLKEHGGIYVP